MNKTKDILEKTNPEIAAEWNYERNKDIDLSTITIGSHKKVWWICKDNHEWETQVYHRKNNGCPYCNGKKAIKGVNDIFSVFPELKKEWDFDKNEINPEETLAKSTKMAYWICPKNHPYKTNINNRTSKGHNCPICSNQLIVPGINDLQTVYPEIAAEWDYSLNDITPDKVAPSAKAEYHWVCKYNHPWKATVNKRTSHNTGCPICANKIVVPGINDLTTTHPEIAAEWSDKNDKKPTEITIGSKYKAIWKCSKCEKEWKSVVHTRKQCGCPRCKESHGEKEIASYLLENGISYEPQYRIEDCRYKNTLPFDFAIIKNNVLLALIEYDGIQHFECVAFGGKNKREQLENLEEIKMKDKIKTDYCKQNNIPLLRIKYTDYDKIKSILNKFLSEINGGIL